MVYPIRYPLAYKTTTMIAATTAETRLRQVGERRKRYGIQLGSPDVFT